MKNSMRILFAGGGSGGHILPAVAVAQELVRHEPRTEILFITSEKKLDTAILSAYPFHHLPLPAPKIPARKRDLPLFALEIAGALAAALRQVRRFNPDVVVGSGAYASVPPVLAAKILRKPVLLFEPNARPGRATRLLSRLAETTICSHRETVEVLRPQPALVLGTPVRRSIQTASRKDACVHFGLHPRRKTLLVLGGSQGARSVNRIVAAALPTLFGNGLTLNVIHQTGPDDLKEIEERYRLLNLKATVLPYIEQIDLALAAADVAVSRAGAITIAEMAARNIPPVLIPLPHAVEADQMNNAREMERRGAAQIVEENDHASQNLTQTLHDILNGSGLAKSMSRNLDKIARPDARDEIARFIMDHAKLSRQ